MKPVGLSVPWEASAQALYEAVNFREPTILLESARTHPVTGRYSILVGEPDFVLTSRGGRAELKTAEGIQPLPGGPLEEMERLLDAWKTEPVPGLPPFVGGAVGYFSYDACRLWQPLPSRAAQDLDLPEIAFLFCSQTLVIDHAEGKLWAIALDRDPDRGRDRARALLERAARPKLFVVSSSNHERTEELVSTHTRESFEAMVRQAKQRIADGEIYQANLSQRFDLAVTTAPWELYRRLTRINPSPFAAFADLGFLQIISASPERLLKVSGDLAETRPIAGTRPRGQSSVETARLRTELLLNEKERAEHLMLVDLERNDLGRFCRYGTVRVDDWMALEEYSHVIHIVSNVRGTVNPGARWSEMVKAVFPGGTITGCPKIRCMEIIEELEPVRRQLYTGSLGYLSATGAMDLNILIRTAFSAGGRLYFQAGAGIVADSDPSREYDETLHKARALRELFEPDPVLV